jgi:hypothetical protein
MSQALSPNAENHRSDFDLTSAREFPKDAPTVFPRIWELFAFGCEAIVLRDARKRSRLGLLSKANFPLSRQLWQLCNAVNNSP